MASLPRARLADFTEQAGAIRFRIAHSTDISLTVSELKRRVPTWARTYDPQSREWTIKHEYRDILSEIFINAPGRVGEERRERGQSRQGVWFALVVVALVTAVAILWANPPPALTNLLERRSRAAPEEAAATATAASAGAITASTPAPAQGPQQARVTSVANLRSGPGTSYEVQSTTRAGDTVTAVGKARGDDNYWWLRLDSGAWIRSDLVVSTATGELPLDLALIPEVAADGSGGPAPAAAGTAGSAPSGVQDATNSDGRVRAVVTWVTDGDTIHVMIGGREYRVRYFGIDTPERDEPIYESASEANRQLVLGNSVLLESDITDTDSYGRLLRYVWLEDGRMVQEELLRAGMGVSTYFPPDVKYRDRLLAAEAAAQAARSGVWQ